MPFGLVENLMTCVMGLIAAAMRRRNVKIKRSEEKRMTVVTPATCEAFGIHNVNEAELARRGVGQSSLVARNVRINGRRTSMRLEPEFWGALRDVARREGRTVADICSQAAQDCPGSVTSAVRVYVLRRLMGN